MKWKTFVQLTALGYLGFRGVRSLTQTVMMPEWTKAGLIDPNKPTGSLHKIPEQRTES